MKIDVDHIIYNICIHKIISRKQYLYIYFNIKGYSTVLSSFYAAKVGMCVCALAGMYSGFFEISLCLFWKAAYGLLMPNRNNSTNEHASVKQAKINIMWRTHVFSVARPTKHVVALFLNFTFGVVSYIGYKLQVISYGHETFKCENGPKTG